MRSMILLRLAVSALTALTLLAAVPARAYELCDTTERVSDVVSDEHVRQRIVDAAVDEWRRFGFQVMDFSTSEEEADLAPLLGFSVPQQDVPPALFGQPKGRLVRIGFQETEYETMDAVRGYWRAVIPDPSYVDGIPLTSTAWSAAFVSWVMCRSGFSESQFMRREAHVEYVAGAFVNEAYYGESAQNGYAYVARPFETTPVRPGDLACFSDAPLSFDERRQVSLSGDTRGHTHSHCDIVVGFSGARVLAIGGNIQHSVTMSVFAGRRDGESVYLMGPYQWRAARPYYAVMSLRARPDLANAVTIRYARAVG
jgi:hypothetical protein